MADTEIIFQVRESLGGGYEARVLGYSIFTEADQWEHLKEMMRGAVLCHFDEGEAPRSIRIYPGDPPRPVRKGIIPPITDSTL